MANKTYTRVTGYTFTTGTTVHDVFTKRTENSSTVRPLYWGDLCEALFTLFHINLGAHFRAEVTMVINAKLQLDTSVVTYTITGKTDEIQEAGIFQLSNLEVTETTSLIYNVDMLRHMEEAIKILSLGTIQYGIKVYKSDETLVSSYSLTETGGFSGQDGVEYDGAGRPIYFTTWSIHGISSTGENTPLVESFTVTGCTAGQVYCRARLTGSTTTASTTGVVVKLTPKSVYNTGIPSWALEQVIEDYTVTATATTATGAIFPYSKLALLTYKVTYSKGGYTFYANSNGTITSLNDISVYSTSFSTTYYAYYKQVGTVHTISFYLAEAAEDNKAYYGLFNAGKRFVPSSIGQYQPASSYIGLFDVCDIYFQGTKIFSKTSSATGSGTVNDYSYSYQTAFGQTSNNLLFQLTINNGPQASSFADSDFVCSCSLGSSVINSPLKVNEQYSVGNVSDNRVLNLNNVTKHYGIAIRELGYRYDEGAWWRKEVKASDFAKKYAAHYYWNLLTITTMSTKTAAAMGDTILGYINDYADDVMATTTENGRYCTPCNFINTDIDDYIAYRLNSNACLESNVHSDTYKLNEYSDTKQVVMHKDIIPDVYGPNISFSAYEDDSYGVVFLKSLDVSAMDSLITRITYQYSSDGGNTWVSWNGSIYNNANGTSSYSTTNQYYDIGMPEINFRIIVYTKDGKQYHSTSLYLEWECCFVEGTQVTIDMSGNTKNIEDIVVGDKVLSYDVVTDEKYLSVVKECIQNTHSNRIATLTFEDGTIITMTDYHPILCIDGWKSLTGYRGYPLLSVGDRAVSMTGYTEITDVKREIVPSFTTYNLDVVDIDEDPDEDYNDTFFANGIVVHNGC